MAALVWVEGFEFACVGASRPRWARDWCFFRRGWRPADKITQWNGVLLVARGGRLPYKVRSCNMCVLGRIGGMSEHSFLKMLMVVLSGGLVTDRQANVSKVRVVGLLGGLNVRTVY